MTKVRAHFKISDKDVY